MRAEVGQGGGGETEETEETREAEWIEEKKKKDKKEETGGDMQGTLGGRSIPTRRREGL